MWAAIQNHTRGGIKGQVASAPPGLPHVVFDWDDTLCPTNFIQTVVMPSLDPARQEMPISQDSHFYEPLQRHARVVEAILRSTRQEVAGISILTLAKPGWLEKSSQCYFPDSNLQELFRELDIQMFYADRDSEMAQMLATQKGKDAGVVAKMSAFSSCLKRFYCDSDAQWNILSVGDSTVERDALKEVLDKETSVHAARHASPPLCKTLKLKDKPDLDMLTSQLENLLPSVKCMLGMTSNMDGMCDDRGRLRRCGN
jgi:hypothetical protein